MGGRDAEESRVRRRSRRRLALSMLPALLGAVLFAATREGAARPVTGRVSAARTVATLFDPSDPSLVVRPPPTQPAPTTTAPPPPSPTTTTAPPTPPPPATTAAPAKANASPAVTVPVPPLPRLSPAPVRDGVGPYLGLGTWVDVYDWSHTYTNGRPAVSPDAVDAMADAGVQTLYIQASKHDAPTTVLEPALLRDWTERAGARGLDVVAWYLPTLVDVGRDLERLRAVSDLPGIDGIAVDIEARNVGDVAERNRRLVELSRALRESLPGRTIGAIVLPPVVLEVVNPRYWPGFPYREIEPSYDVWMTMGYWTNRTAASGYRDAYRYTRENVDRLRANLSRRDVPVHPIGGLGAGTSGADVHAYEHAVRDTGSIGGSLYDWRTTRAELWPPMRSFRR